jgi:hypothetical protein
MGYYRFPGGNDPADRGSLEKKNLSHKTHKNRKGDELSG